MHSVPLITTLAAAFTAAWALGLIAQRVGLSPIVGYLLAGVCIGPYTPGFVGDATIAPQLAELGVILLMFGVGLHFHLKDLIAVRTIAIPGAIGQCLVATVAGGIVFELMGWPLTSGVVLGMAMAVASTVVLMRVLMDNDQMNTAQGHAAVGWLIVEDIITVVILVMIPALAGPADADAAHASGSGGWAAPLGIAMAKLALLVAIVLVGGAKVVPWVLMQVARLKSRELFTLTVLVLSIAIATGSAVFFGVSMALGAFLAGMVVAQSPASQQAGAEILPLRDAFAVVFFVAMGMLFDPRFALEHPLLILAGLAIVLVVKPLAALGIVAGLGYPARTGLTVAVGLAQIGEFSFILGEMAREHGLLSEAGIHLLVACALVSITINPMLFRGVAPAERWMRKRARLWRVMNERSERHVLRASEAAVAKIGAAEGAIAIVVGYGPVGQQVERLLRQAGMETVVIELNMDAVVSLTSQGRTAVYGDATRAELLAQAGVAKASHVVLTTAHIAERQAVIGAVKQINPATRLIVRTRYLREEGDARQVGADAVVVDELESALALVEVILAETGADQGRIRAEVERVRRELTDQHRPSQV